MSHEGIMDILRHMREVETELIEAKKPRTFTHQQLWAAYLAQGKAAHAAAQGDAGHETIVYAGMMAALRSLGVVT